MQSIKILGIVVVTMFALSSVAASSAYAEFKEFEVNKTGSLAGKAKTAQRFKTGSGATVECTKLTTPESSVTELKPSRLATTIHYESCSVLIFGAATVSASKWTWWIGGFSILFIVLIKAGGFGEECEIEIKEPQELGTGTGELTYGNGTANGKETITLDSKVTKIKSKILQSSGPNSTTNCGTAGQEATEGAWSGEMEIELVGSGNNIKVK